MKPPKPQCHMCRRKTTDEFFCYGCSVHLCFKCDINACTGKHVPLDHIRQIPGEFSGS